MYMERANSGNLISPFKGYLRTHAIQGCNVCVYKIISVSYGRSLPVHVS